MKEIGINITPDLVLVLFVGDKTIPIQLTLESAADLATRIARAVTAKDDALRARQRAARN